ncbi:hypothetical protein NWP21_11940 [Anabaenopsis sp. FSS-46]|uniref:hypothetical protein n=1 Tax=Anabaenopsis sp. FSS-46 TaxID=2971766 RepID=UPI002476D723|nr:hypothetical protein [Anabaenopsis sp. FSS-46]MDH6099537.1 hypothetical protein [Anabaenopsis sp. FSS-46]
MSVNNSEHVDTLIITVGTRQIGWRCKDHIIRSFGADGNIGYPSHITQLYQELGIERGVHLENDKTYPCSAKDLGQRYYEYCKEWLGGDFSPVELLLDQNIIDQGVKQGLKHIILWGTDQPETVSWFHRRLDTVWIAELMRGKIISLYPQLRVDIHAPKIVANDNYAIRQELELLVLKEALDSFSPDNKQEFVLWIQNKGCAPAIASAVEICAAALVRQCQVFNASPDDPREFFTTSENGLVSANHSQSFQLIPMGEYFWSLERLRIISAWERGDFVEAQLWLRIHQNKYELLYKLAGFLAKYSNWESHDQDFFRKLKEWLNSRHVSKTVDGEQLQAWNTQLDITQGDDLTKLWESTIIIDLSVQRENYTTAFIQFAQILERLLYIQSTRQNWARRGWKPQKSDEPSLYDLIQGWCDYQRYNQNHQWSKLLTAIREKRNEVIHEGKSITLRDIRHLWNNNNFPVRFPETPEIIKNLMMDVLKKIIPPPSVNQLLMRSLYQWGLDYLKNST